MPTAGRGPRAAVAPARDCAYAVVRRVFEQGAYADRALTAQARDLPSRDRALATAIAYGTVQRRATLDHVAERLSERPIGTLDPAVRAALEIGLLQLLYLDGVAVHAAVHESVELAKAHSGRGAAGLVNAVLRRATREGPGLIAALSDDTPAGAAIKHSVPEWLAVLWFAELGAESARSLLAHVNTPAEAALRVNTLVTDVDAVRAELPVPTHRVDGLPEALVLEAPFDIHGSALFSGGAVMPQSRGSMLAGRALAPGPGDRVLDLCAAPGAKATQLAALGGGGERLVAVERHPGRARALSATLERKRVTGATVQTADATVARPAGERYEAVLVDPPCSGLGTLQSRPDLRWRTSPDRVSELAGLQAAVLRAGAAATAAGGALVYSVCTISRAEGMGVLEPFLAEHPEFSADPPVQTLPHRDGTDGFFIARLRREG